MKLVLSPIEKRFPNGIAEAGVHVHNLERENSRTKRDGAHRHLFVLPDGSRVWSVEDGAHEHALPSDDADEIPESGAHTHGVELPDGTSLVTDEDGEHEHQLQAWSTAFDGIHAHALRLPSGDVIRNLSPGEYWEQEGEPAQSGTPDAPPASELAKREQSADYMRAVLDTARSYLPKWLWRQIHAASFPSSGGRARWRDSGPGPVEKLALEQIRPARLRQIPDDDLSAVWLRLHQWYANAKRRKEAVENFVNAAAWVLAELLHRGKRVGDTELAGLARQFVKLRKSFDVLAFDELPSDVVLVEEFVSVVGSAAKEANAPGDLDVLFRARRDERGENYLVQAENVWLPVRNALGKALPLHFVDNPQGPHGDCVPLYDLVLRRRDVPARRVIRSAPVRVDLGCGDARPEGYVGLDRKPGQCVDVVYDMERGLPFAPDSIDEFRASHSLEHVRDADGIMRAIFRALRPGGRLVFEVPSTKGEGAFAHPDHKSWWNKSTFHFWSQPDLVEDRPRFDVVELNERTEGDLVYVSGVLEKPSTSRVAKALAPFESFIPPKPSLRGLTEAFDVKELQDWADGKYPIDVEPKLNGFRAVAERKGERLRLWFEGERGSDKLPKFPELRRAFEQIPGDWILDGDVAIERDGKRLPRADLGTLNADRPELGAKDVVVFTAFDVPYHERDLSDRPFRERRAVLEKIVRPSGIVSRTPARWADGVGDLPSLVRWAFAHDRSEGLVAKTARGKYEAGPGTDEWFKLKKIVELKVRVLDVVRNKAGAWNYRGGLATTKDEGYTNTREQDGKLYLDLGETYSSQIEARTGDVITVQVLEMIPDEDKHTLAWLGAQVLDVDRTRSTPYAVAQAVDIAERGGVLQKAAELGEEGGGHEPGPRGEAALKFWREHWQELFPKSGHGRFVYHHHWRGLDEDETKLDDAELLRTDHSVHGDLRLEARDGELWGLSVFLGTTEANRRARGDRLVSLPPDDNLQTQPKLAQPEAWLDVGRRAPLVVEPGGVGSTSEKFSKFFALDSGTYDVGVWREHGVELFLRGDKLRGRFLVQFAPLGDRRVWIVDKPTDQTPKAERVKIEDEIADVKSKGQKWLVWAKPGQRPELVDVETGRVQKSVLAPIRCFDDEKRLIYAVAMEPDEVDAHGEFATKEEIEQACHAFMQSRVVGVEHGERADAEIVESAIYPADVVLGGQRVKAGSWVVAIHVTSDPLWKRAKAGEFGGVSVGGWARREAGRAIEKCAVVLLLAKRRAFVVAERSAA